MTNKLILLAFLHPAVSFTALILMMTCGVTVLTLTAAPARGVLTRRLRGRRARHAHLRARSVLNGACALPDPETPVIPGPRRSADGERGGDPGSWHRSDCRCGGCPSLPHAG